MTPPRRAYHAAAWEDVSAALWIHGGIDAHEVRGGKMAKGFPRNGKGYVPSLKLAAGIAPENRGFPPGFWEIPHLETIFF